MRIILKIRIFAKQLQYVITMTPEEKARQKIDRWFEEAGWKVINRDEYEAGMSAVAIREGLLAHNLEADYFLLINGKAVGVLEAKREDTDISSNGVSEQVATYAHSVPPFYTAWQKPLPVLLKSNGKEILFKDFRETDKDWETIPRILTPKDICRLLEINDPFAGLPTLQRRGLRDCQYEAITELEKSFRAGQNRALIVLATGAGKTYTACLAAYRMLAYTPMRRILFLVDRNNLGRQAETEFGTFRLTETGDPFNTIYSVNRLRSSKIPTDSNVVISTIQRLFSLLKGDDISDDDEADDEDTTTGNVSLPTNPRLPRDFFDMIIIDECHRSIYGNWQSVLEYFDKAKLVGLTATPVPETMAFFNNNRVVNYTLEQSIADGVNVDARIYRIKTQATEEGGVIKAGSTLKHTTRYTGKEEIIKSRETRNYTSNELNRSIVNPAQIRLILQTFRDDVYSEMFNDPPREPDFRYLPKTLIFALNEAHATNITDIARQVFAEVCPHADMERYVQKITYSAADSNELIRQFRNDKDFRIAVTCTLVATGTDVKPLEVVMFMRDVESEALYTQMKGRGVRTIGDEQLRAVTPNATSKDYFVLIDAVGVTEHEHYIPEFDDRDRQTETITLKELLERITHGFVPDNYLRRLASTLSRLYNKADTEQRNTFAELAHDDMRDLALRIFSNLEEGKLPPFVSTDYSNTERRGLVAPLANHANARKYLLVLAAGFVNTLMPGEDTLISKGFSKEAAQDTTSAFETYCEQHKDDIEAMRIIYNNESEPITYSMLHDLEAKLRNADSRFSPSRLWNSYAVLKPQAVKRNASKEERDALTNIIQLVRFAYKQISQLYCIVPTARQFFELWCGQKQGGITATQKEVMSQVVDYVASNGSCTVKDFRTIYPTTAARLIRAFSGIKNADSALYSMYNFIVFRKKTA